jgi:DNA-binding NarL/FixJ family response regulator
VARVDPISVIEAGYRLEGTEERWLARLAKAARPLLEGGHGVYAYRFDMSGSQVPYELSQVVVLGTDPRHVEEVFAAGGRHIDPSVLRKLHTLPKSRAVPRSLQAAGASFREWGLPQPEPIVELRRRWGVDDYLALCTIEPGGHGVAIVGPQRHPRRFTRRTCHLWARVAAHVAAGRRLRAALDAAGEAADAASGAEAILTSSGRVEHAEGAAKATNARLVLQRAVLAQERARTRSGRQDPEASTRAWTALVSGRWSLVDHFESGGRRYLVARPNPLPVPDPRALTERERAVAHLAVLGKSNKLIAYELGIHASTVANHLAAAMRKLGIASRTELVTLMMSGLGPPSSPR